jgi:hypothetical protein
MTVSLRLKAVCVLGILAVMLPACSSRPALPGKWRSAPPSSLLFEFQSDHSVLLYQDGRVYKVFNYKLLDGDTLQLFDGMGRLRQVDFEINGNQMFFFDPEQPGDPAEVFEREE